MARPPVSLRPLRRSALLVVLLAACSSSVSEPLPGSPAPPDPQAPDLPPDGPFDASVEGPKGPPPQLPLAQSPGAAPISGGTLLVAADGHTVVASDPERDVVFVGDLDAPPGLATIALRAGDEPGRVIEDGARRVHVALRRGGALVTIDLAKGAVIGRRDVCPAPRGIAYDAAADAVVVACATGELVTLPAGGGPATRTMDLGRDLRDVVVGQRELLVSRFRTGDVLHVDASGAITRTESLAAVEAPNGDVGGLKDLGTMTPSVAWRMRPAPDGGAIV